LSEGGDEETIAHVASLRRAITISGTTDHDPPDYAITIAGIPIRTLFGDLGVLFLGPAANSHPPVEARRRAGERDSTPSMKRRNSSNRVH
jgi:hypothetical protein